MNKTIDQRPRILKTTIQLNQKQSKSSTALVTLLSNSETNSPTINNEITTPPGTADMIATDVTNQLITEAITTTKTEKDTSPATTNLEAENPDRQRPSNNELFFEKKASRSKTSRD